LHHRLVTGHDLLEVSSGLVHPRVQYLRNQSDKLKAQIEDLEKQVAYRPSPSQVMYYCHGDKTCCMIQRNACVANGVDNFIELSFRLSFYAFIIKLGKVLYN
jgi:hypothetical protein